MCVDGEVDTTCIRAIFGVNATYGGWTPLDAANDFLLLMCYFDSFPLLGLDLIQRQTIYILIKMRQSYELQVPFLSIRWKLQFP